MKKYLLKIALFFVLVAIVDFGFGRVCDYLRDHTKGGFSGNVHYICEQCDEDIIMMGSSRMRHHYVPHIFEDSLGMSCYNAGIDGNGIILSYGFLKMILERYTPKMIIYDVTGYDMYVDDNTKYLDGLRPFYFKPGISNIFYDVAPSEKWKMISSLYRYNSDLLGLVGDNIHPLQSFDKGYWPYYKEMNYEPDIPRDVTCQIDSLKLQYICKFIKLAKEKKIDLFFVASPSYFGNYVQDYHNPIRIICESNNVLFINRYWDENLSSSKGNWADPSHLNDTGAKLFSRELVRYIINKSE